MLKKYHGRNCKAPRCGECGVHHNTLLHRPKTFDTESVHREVNRCEIEASAAVARAQPRVVTIASDSSGSVCCSHDNKQSPQVLFSTVIVLVRDRDGILQECRALLDSGSQSNIITRNLSKRLKLKGEAISTTITAISDACVNSAQQVCARIVSRVKAFQVSLPFLILDKITDSLPMFEIDRESFEHSTQFEIGGSHFSRPW